ncbi:UNVERIFIED_CONTAM: hypothetical protein FKN15_041903 [Acipenser sinensis]
MVLTRAGSDWQCDLQWYRLVQDLTGSVTCSGVHTWQQMYGCELDGDGTKQGFDQYGYDGEDFIIFDKDTLTWTAASQRGFTTKVKWDARSAMNRDWKVYLEGRCIEWLQKHYLPAVPPAVTVLQRKARGSADTEVLCHVTGFFPRAVEVTWVRDGRDQLEEGVHSGEVLPNQDGTYQLRKILTVSPEEQRRHSYSCQVDHVSFKERQNYNWVPESGPPIGIIAGVIVGVLALAAVIIGVVIWKKRQGGERVRGEKRERGSELQCFQQTLVYTYNSDLSWLRDDQSKIFYHLNHMFTLAQT